MPTGVDPRVFIAGLADERRQREAAELMTMMHEVTREPAVMWGPSIVGFGTYSYKYATGREGLWPRAGFSPRKQSLTVYCVPGFKNLGGLLARLGPHTTSVSCLYIKRLEDVDREVLAAIVKRSFDAAQSFEA